MIQERVCYSYFEVFDRTLESKEVILLSATKQIISSRLTDFGDNVDVPRTGWQKE